MMRFPTMDTDAKKGLPRLTIQTRSFQRFLNLLIPMMRRRTSRPAVIEICAGLWGRAFATARVEPDNIYTAALTPAVLDMIGRESFAKRGSCILDRRASDSGVSLSHLPAHWEITGGESWSYRLSIPTPNGTITRSVPAESVIHPRYAVSPNESWKGIGPLSESQTSVDLVRVLELTAETRIRCECWNADPCPRRRRKPTERRDQSQRQDRPSA